MMIVKTPRSTLVAALDCLLTALAWAAFCFLFASGVQSLLVGPAPAADPVVSRLLPDAQALLAYTLVAAWIGLLMAAWACYNAVRFSGIDRRKPLGDTLPAEMASHFGISPMQLQVLRSSRTILFHHTDEGRISMIDFAHDADAVCDSIQMKQ
jgi:biofilm PGA synthesis protein PgaD